MKVLQDAPLSEPIARLSMASRLRETPIPDSQLLENLPLFLPRQDLSRILFIHSLYQRIIPVHGSIIEFGTRWGANMALLSTLRSIYEPFNYNRKIIGFDTFQGFPSTSKEDGPLHSPGDYSVSANWKTILESILQYHENNAPIPHIKKYELVEGDVCNTLPKYLKDHPETIIAMAYFDMDLYEPTKVALQAVLPYLTKGSILAFDELNCPEFPGETLAVRQTFGILSRYAIQRSPLCPLAAFFVIN